MPWNRSSDGTAEQVGHRRLLTDAQRTEALKEISKTVIVTYDGLTQAVRKDFFEHLLLSTLGSTIRSSSNGPI